MNSCSVKHYILAIDDNNQDDASYTAQIDDGDKWIRHTHHSHALGDSPMRRGPNGEDTSSFGHDNRI